MNSRPRKDIGAIREKRLDAEAQFFQSPWADETQKFRNYLLVVSMFGILMAAAGIFPKKITALGLEVEDINQYAILIIWAIIVAYFTVTYSFYAYSDFMRGYWRELNKFEFEILELPDDEAIGNIVDSLVDSQMRLKSRLKNLHEIRLLLDVVVPLLAGMVTFIWLLWRVFHL